MERETEHINVIMLEISMSVRLVHYRANHFLWNETMDFHSLLYERS